MKTHYRTVMISDSHLCSRDCHSKDLLDFLKSVKCDHLYIIGDFIDIWQLQRKWLWTQEYNDILRRILKMAQKGTNVVFVPGNHDEFFRQFIGSQFGEIKIAGNFIHTTAAKKRLYITHGDEFDNIIVFNKWLAQLGSIGYDYLISFNGIINWFRRLFGMEYWSFAAYVKRKIKNADVYINRFREAVMAEAKKAGATGAVCGHIHTPEIRELGDFLYCNTGDWVDSNTALVELEDGQLEILKYKEMMKNAAGSVASS